MYIDDLSFDIVGADGTDSPWFGQGNYGGQPQDIVGDMVPIDAYSASPYFTAEQLTAYHGDEWQGDNPLDLTALGIDGPMTWGSEFADTTGWDELGADYFGWSPFKAVASAVKAVGKVTKAIAKPVVKVAAKTSPLAIAKAVVPKSIQKAVTKAPVLKQVASVVRAVDKVASAPQQAVFNIATGGNILANLRTLAPAAQTALSFVPGVGTLAAMGIAGTTAALQGKSLASIAEGTLKGAIPGGQLVELAATVAAKAMLAGVQGQNMAKAASREVITGAIDLIPDKTAAATLRGAVDAALTGKNMLTGATAAALNTALKKVTDASARSMFTAVMGGKASSPYLVLKTAPPKLIANTLVTAKQGALAQAIATTGKAATTAAAKPAAKPSGITAPVRKPTVSQQLSKTAIIKPTATGAALVFPASSATTMATGLSTAAGIAAAINSNVPTQAAAAKQIALNTYKVANTPGPDQKAAQVGLAAMAMAANSRKQEAVAAAPPALPARTPAEPANMPPVAFGGRRISNVIGKRRVTHDVSPQGMIATYVTQ